MTQQPEIQADLDLLSGFVQHLEDGKPLKVGDPIALAAVLRRVLSAAYPAVPRPEPVGDLREKVARLAWPSAFAAKDQDSSAARRAVAEAFDRADQIIPLVFAALSDTAGVGLAALKSLETDA